MIRLILETITRGVAAILFISGFGAAFFVLNQAKELYTNPEAVEIFAVHIENATAIDKKLSAVLSGVISIEPDTANDADTEGDNQPGANPTQAQLPDISESTIRLSYFLAWIIIILLLSLRVRIALARVSYWRHAGVT